MQYHMQSCIGYALHETEYPAALHAQYIAHIRARIESALKYPEMLPLMGREGLIDADAFLAFFDAIAERGNVELTALLLEYKHTHLINGTSERDNDLSLNEQVHSSPSAAS